MADAVDTTAQAYFLVIVILGALFIVNLAIAQMTVSFEKASQEEKKRLESEKDQAAIGPKPFYVVFQDKWNSWVEARFKSDELQVGADDAIDDDDQEGQKLKILAQQRQRQYEQEERERQRKLKEQNALEVPMLVDEEQGALPKDEWEEVDGAAAAAAPLAIDRAEATEAQPPMSAIAQKRRLVRNMLYSRKGQLVIGGVILLNVVQMSLDFYQMPYALEVFLYISTLIFTSFYTLEMILRWFALGLFGYFRYPVNIVDLLIVVLSWIDEIVPSMQLPIVRAARLLRLFSIAKVFPELYQWLLVIQYSIRSSIILAAVIAMGMFVVASLGMQLFGGTFCGLTINDNRPDDTVPFCLNRPRANYDSISNAMITSFQIMTGDNWNDIMYNGMRAQGAATSFYFVLWLLLSNIILVNLVIAILLGARAEALEHAEAQALELQRLQREAEGEDEYERRVREAQEEKMRIKKEAEEARKEKEKEVVVERTPLQETVLRFTNTIQFDGFMVSVITVSSICMALESPYKAPDTTQETILSNVDLAANIIFLLELLLKVFAFGFIMTRDSYLRRDLWNVFDFVVLLASLVGNVAQIFNFRRGGNILRTIRILRSIRPLRFIAKSEGLTIVMLTLAASVRPLRNLVVIIFAVFTWWGILGVQLYKGSFYTCSDSTFNLETNCTASGHAWQNAELHFDHLPAAYTALFSMVTMDGWTRVLWDGVDSVGPGQGFQVNHSKAQSFYFISFIVVGALFFVNLFVSILIDQYQRQKQKGGSVNPFLSPAQAAWIRSQYSIVGLVPVVDYDNDNEDVIGGNPLYATLRGNVRAFVRHPLFDVMIYCFIIVNFLVMAADRFPKSDSLALVIQLSNVVFTLLFLGECILKIFAESPERYFFSNWNRFDFVIVTLSVFSLVSEYLLASTTFASFFRTMRVLRLLRLLRKTRRLQIVLKRFAYALYSLKNVAAIVLLLFFIFGVMGVKLFGRVQHNGAISHRSNFGNIENAMIMLLRACTAGEWTPVMVQCASGPSSGGCDPNIDSCGVNILAQIYFIAFITLGSFVALNLFIAVVLESFTTNSELDFDFLTEFEAGQLLQLWLRFDPESTYRMYSKYFVTFLRAIPPTCHVSMGQMPIARRRQYELVWVEALQLHEFHGLIELQDVIYSMCRSAYKTQLPVHQERRLTAKTNLRFRREQRDSHRPDGKGVGVEVRYAVMIIEAYWERRKQILATRESVLKLTSEREALRRLESLKQEDRLNKFIGGNIRRRKTTIKGSNQLPLHLQAPSATGLADDDDDESPEMSNSRSIGTPTTTPKVPPSQPTPQQKSEDRALHSLPAKREATPVGSLPSPAVEEPERAFHTALRLARERDLKAAQDQYLQQQLQNNEDARAYNMRGRLAASDFKARDGRKVVEQEEEEERLRRLREVASVDRDALKDMAKAEDEAIARRGKASRQGRVLEMSGGLRTPAAAAGSGEVSQCMDELLRSAKTPDDLLALSKALQNEREAAALKKQARRARQDAALKAKKREHFGYSSGDDDTRETQADLAKSFYGVATASFASSTLVAAVTGAPTRARQMHGDFSSESSEDELKKSATTGGNVDLFDGL